MIAKKIVELLKKREFISIATCDFNCLPNVAPKFLLKLEDNFIYLADYVIGKTFENLKVNPKVSLSIMDTDMLKGYQVIGSVEIIEQGPQYIQMLDEFRQKGIRLATERIIKGIQSGQGHESFEAAFPDKIAIFKVKIEEVTEILTSGELKKEKL